MRELCTPQAAAVEVNTPALMVRTVNTLALMEAAAAEVNTPALMVMMRPVSAAAAVVEYARYEPREVQSYCPWLQGADSTVPWYVSCFRAVSLFSRVPI